MQATQFFDEETGNTPLMYAVHHGDVDAVHALLEHGFNVFHANKEEHNALHAAVHLEDLDVLTLLLHHLYDQGADAFEEVFTTESLMIGDEFPDVSSEALLDLAAATNSIGVILRGLQAGVSPNIHNVNGFTPLLLAVSLNEVDAARQMIQLEAHVNVYESDGWYEPCHRVRLA